MSVKQPSKRKPNVERKRHSPLVPRTGYASVSSMRKVNSAKLTRENRVYIHPVCALPNNRYMVGEGWKVIGWSDAPWKSAIGAHAIVYEKISKMDMDSLDTHAHFEPGIYWGHGDADKMQFCETLPAELEDEIGPWVRKHNERS